MALQAGRAEERLAVLVDPRSLHRELFAGLVPADLPDAAGTWRGTPGTSLAHARRAVFVARRAPGLRARDLCAPPNEVEPRMAVLARQVERAWDDAPGTEREGLCALASFLGEFFAIHPFLDGNGHVGRLLALLLAGRLGLQAEGWAVHRRPYGPTMSLCLQWHAHHPELLEDHLRRWFRRPLAA